MEEPDYMLRLEGFQAANSIVKQMVTMETETCLTLVYNCCFFITTVSIDPCPAELGYTLPLQTV